MELNPTQIIIIGLIVTILVQVIKLIAAKIGKPIDRKLITVFLFVLALGLAYLWASPTLPHWPVLTGEPGAIALAVLTFIGDLIGVASVVVGFATVIYNLLLQRVFDALGVGKGAIEKLQPPVK